MNVIQPSCYNCKNQKLYHEYYGGKSFPDTRYTCKIKLKGIIWHPLDDFFKQHGCQHWEYKGNEKELKEDFNPRKYTRVIE